MKHSQDKKANIGLEEKNSILQAWANLKDSIFNVLFVLLDKNDDEEQQQSVWGLVFQSGLDYLQMMAFPFNVAIIQVWNGGQTLNSITMLFQKFNLSTYLPGVSFSAFLILLYSLIFLIILVILDIVYVSYSFSKKKFKFTWPLVLLAQIVPLFVTVFFLPMTQTLLSVVQCQSSAQGFQVMQSFPNIACWQSWHLFHAAVTLLFVSIFVFICCVVALALFQPRMTTNKLTARQNSRAQVVFIFNKIVNQFIFSFTPFSQTWIYCAILFVLAFWQFWCYSVNEPYYNKKATKFFKIVSTYYFWTIFMLMISQILSIYDFTGGLVIWLGGLPFICIVILFQRKSNIAKLFSSNLKFRTGQQLESHITYVLQLIENQQKDKNSYMLLIGYIEKHKQICTQEDCPFNKHFKKKKKNGKNEMEDNCVQLLKQLERMYKMGIKKYPQSTKLRISFAFFHLQRTKNKNKAYEQFTNAENTDPSFEEEFIIYRFKKIIKENLQDDQKQIGSDLIQMIRFDNHISLCEEAMLISARLHKQFWTQLKEQTPDLKKLNNIGSKITQTSNAVKQNYIQITKINSSVPEILHNYSIYLLLILQDYSEGGQMFANAKKIYQDKITGVNRNQDEVNQKNEKTLSPMIIISSNQGKFGKVINCNLMFTQMTGYYKQQICDRDFQKILPDTYKLAHQYTLNQWNQNQNNQSQYFLKSNEGYIKHKSGTIIPVLYFVRYNVVEQEFIVTFKLDSIRGSKCVLLVNSMGVIRDCSLLSKSYFQIDPNNIQTELLYLQNLGIQNFQNQKYVEGYKKQLIVQQCQKLCQIKITPILMKTDYKMDQDQRDDQSYQLLKTNNQSSKQIVGYIVQINIITRVEKSSKDIQLIGKSQKIIQDNLNNQIQFESVKLTQNNQINNQILDLYQPPQLNFLFLNSIAQTKREEVVLRQFQLTQKIKTMRLMNNQIKMVYNQGSENDYNSNQEGLNFQDQREMSKFDDQNYQSKLRKAINTNINHIEVTKLRWASIIFILLLFVLIILQLVFSMENLNQIQLAIKNSNQRTLQIQTLSKHISGSILPLYDNSQYFEQLINYKIQFDSDQLIKYSLNDDGVVVQKHFKDVLIILHAKLVDYFYHSGAFTLENVYYNYINYVYTAFQQYHIAANMKFFLPYLFFSFVIILSITMIILWISISLMINKKKFDIMIWFLDIPIPYVSHLGAHCDKYLKQFVGIKQLMEKGINIDQQINFRQFDQTKDHNKQDQVQQQIKARKSLIAKHRKQTLFSKLNCGYILFFWILVYSSLVSIIMIAMSQNLINKFNYILPQWQLTYHQINWDCALPITLKLQEKYQTIGSVNLTTFSETLKTNHLNTITRFNMEGFNQGIQDFDTQFSELYNKIYYKSLCNLAIQSGNSSQAVQCKQILDSKLSGGYTVYSTYISSSNNSQTDKIRIANQKYSIPELVNLLQSWKTNLSNQINNSISLCEITLYLYIILSGMGFLIFWMMYLKSLNTQLNQTIQMLNMIPFKLLPKSRKQTKQFITWIIKEANKKNHENQ